jgi:UDP-N-acetylmuramate--alanine ligase
MNIHFVGIGGIGMSALAKYYLVHGAVVSGSDLVTSEITDDLKKLGVPITIGKHEKKNLPQNLDRVICTAATVQSDNSEVKQAKRCKIDVQTYAEAIGELTKKYKTITISGAHGKSTTTALTALVLEEGYHDPTVIVGTKLKEFGDSNFRKGSGSYLVLEADEWNKSFLQYSPHIAVITNIDVEHLDTYKKADAVEKTFEEYLEKVPPDGMIVANRDDDRLWRVAQRFGKKVFWYSIFDRGARDVKRVLRVPGEHNISNAMAAMSVGRLLGVQQTDILRAVSRFTGTWRRFEFKGIFKGAHIVDDYGHHPNEITATIAAARERFPMRRIWCVYQPHQYQRLSYLWDGFLSAFDMADRVCLLPVYDVAGRETIQAKASVNSLRLAQELVRRGKRASHLDTFNDAKAYLSAEVKAGDVVLIMGAGDIYKLTPQLLNYHETYLRA